LLGILGARKYKLYWYTAQGSHSIIKRGSFDNNRFKVLEKMSQKVFINNIRHNGELKYKNFANYQKL
jgi:hypothetical protein